MSIITLIISASILLILLVLHSYIIRGFRVTAVFFLFAFTLMLFKEVALPAFVKKFVLPSLINTHPSLPRQHYVFLLKNVPEIISKSAVVIGWMITFYLSWYFAEQVLSRFSIFKKRFFAMLAFSMIVAACVSYCLENFSMAMGWWIWRFYTPSFERFLMNCPIEAIGGWTHMSLIFLFTFFLMECSGYKTAKWKNIFFLTPLIPILFCFFFGFRNLIVMLDFAVVNVILFAFLSPAQFFCVPIKLRSASSKILPYINQLPLIVLLLMLLYITVIEVFLLKQPFLLISTAPLLIIILLSIRKLSLFYMLILTIGMFIILKEKAVFPSIPVIFAIILWGIEKITRSFKIPQPSA